MGGGGGLFPRTPLLSKVTAPVVCATGGHTERECRFCHIPAKETQAHAHQEGTPARPKMRDSLPALGLDYSKVTDKGVNVEGRRVGFQTEAH